MRESGVWTYGIVNLAHILGIAMLFGAILVLDLRLLGLWQQMKLVSVSRPLVSIAAIGLALAVANLGGKMKFEQESESLPLVIRMGSSMTHVTIYRSCKRLQKQVGKR